MLIMICSGGPAADPWAICLCGELDNDSTIMTWSDQPGWMNRTLFIKCSWLYFHTAPFTNKKNTIEKKQNKHRTGNGATSGSRTIIATVTARRVQHCQKPTTLQARHDVQDQCGYLSYLRGVTETASTNPVSHPITLCHTRISNTADVGEAPAVRGSRDLRLSPRPATLQLWRFK